MTLRWNKIANCYNRKYTLHTKVFYKPIKNGHTTALNMLFLRTSLEITTPEHLGGRMVLFIVGDNAIGQLNLVFSKVLMWVFVAKEALLSSVPF